VLLDAYGTLLRLPPPAPRLRALLAAEGHEHAEARVAEAVAAEVRHYRRHHDRGRDPASLAALRRECAGVIADELGGDAPPLDRLAELLVDCAGSSCRRPSGARRPGRPRLQLGVVSNWDYGLPDVLAALGVADRFAVVATSAAAARRSPTRPSSRGAGPAGAAGRGAALRRQPPPRLRRRAGRRWRGAGRPDGREAGPRRRIRS
jgi:FMN phosphatase YigB (HAD superfamily)